MIRAKRRKGRSSHQHPARRPPLPTMLRGPPPTRLPGWDFFCSGASLWSRRARAGGGGAVATGVLTVATAMAKATTIKEALAKWEEKNGQKASEAKEVKLYGQIPPVQRMDESLSTLVNCEKLSLSTNCIERIANLSSLKKLRILSLGRNNIKNLNGLEAVADTLEELWISYNFIEKLMGIRVMKKLKVLYMSNNLVKDWAEFERLAELPLLEDLVFVGNPLQEKYASDQKNSWIEEATKRVPTLKKLDVGQY
ncbi:dynein axonemal light chain 1 isoform X2 [Cuculus canorus]|uniref:dynein axonemal light chain 1 isoform X2 n=1 Tax=Cuculus canorus TaxID=55661 RepID=UPI0023AADE4E|nr:dynein axonemal light chain 1 isoform X2 [Cuculus canorus]